MNSFSPQWKHTETYIISVCICAYEYMVRKVFKDTLIELLLHFAKTI